MESNWCKNKPWYKEMKRVEALSEPVLKELRVKKARRQASYVYNNSPFYRQKFDDLGIKPRDIQTWEDFRQLPIYVCKEDEKREQERSLEEYGHPFTTWLCTPVANLEGISSTTGTTGEPTFTYLYTSRDYRRHHEIAARHFWQMGLTPADVVVYAAGMANLSGLRVYEHALRAYGCAVAPVGAEAGTERILKIINLVKPTTFLATGPLIEYLIEAAPKVLGKEVRDLKLKRVISSGAPAAAIPEVKKKIEEAYQCRLYDSFGGYLGVSCDLDEYQGLHAFARDYVVYHEDMVDPNTKKPIMEIKDGTIGECLVTMLEWQARPFFKFGMGDVAQVFTEECECGLKTPRLKLIGRADDMLILKGVNVYPQAIKSVVESFAPRTTGEVRAVLDEPGPGVKPPLKLKIEHGLDITSDEQKKILAQELEDAMHTRLKFRAAIELLTPNTLERAAGPGAKGQLIERTYQKR